MRIHRGFTLIELLVVIGIIGILAAIMFPVFASVREKARTTQCINNQRQIMTAVTMYIQDNDEMLFPSAKVPWPYYLSNLIPAGQIFDCPTKTGIGSASIPEYGFNRFIQGMAIGQIASPATTIAIADIDPTYAGTLSPPYCLTQYDDEINISPRHNNSANITMLDGHVENVFFNPNVASLYATLAQRGLTLTFPQVQDVLWSSLTGTVQTNPNSGSGSTLSTVGGSDAWGNCGAVSAQVINGDGYFQWVFSGGAGKIMTGLTAGTSVLTYGDVTLASYANAGTQIQQYYNPITAGPGGTTSQNAVADANYTANICRVERKAGLVTFSVSNSAGVTKYTLPNPYLPPLRAGSAFHNLAGVYISNCQIAY